MIEYLLTENGGGERSTSDVDLWGVPSACERSCQNSCAEYVV